MKITIQRLDANAQQSLDGVLLLSVQDHRDGQVVSLVDRSGASTQEIIGLVEVVVRVDPTAASVVPSEEPLKEE